MKPAIQSALFAALAFTASAALAQTTNPAPYCSGSFDDGQNFALHYISNVHLGTLNHTSPAQEGALPHYFFYNNVAAPTLQPGQSYSISISHDPAGSSMHFCAAYIDFNGDHVFQDNERVLEQSEFVGTGIANPSVATFTVPATAVAGTTRLRAIVFEDDNYSFGSGTTTAAHAKPCTADGTPSFDWGEAEDYNVTIAGATALEPAQETSLTMFPNPTTGLVHLGGVSSLRSVAVLDATGRLVLTPKRTGDVLDLSGFPRGLYSVRLETEAGVVVRRVSVE